MECEVAWGVTFEPNQASIVHLAPVDACTLLGVKFLRPSAVFPSSDRLSSPDLALVGPCPSPAPGRAGPDIAVAARPPSVGLATVVAARPPSLGRPAAAAAAGAQYPSAPPHLSPNSRRWSDACGVWGWENPTPTGPATTDYGQNMCGATHRVSLLLHFVTCTRSSIISRVPWY